MTVFFRPSIGNEIIAALVASGWSLVSESDPYYNEPWLRMDRNGETLLAQYDSRGDRHAITLVENSEPRTFMTIGDETPSVAAIVGLAEKRGHERTWFHGRVTKLLRTDAEMREESAREAAELERYADAAAAIVMSLRGTKQRRSYLWFSVSSDRRYHVLTKLPQRTRKAIALG